MKSETALKSESERLEWEEDQKKVDRQWYNLDEGYDETQNPFAGSDEYTRKKELELLQQKKKKMSAQQRQIHKVLTFMDIRNCTLVILVFPLVSGLLTLLCRKMEINYFLSNSF